MQEKCYLHAPSLGPYHDACRAVTLLGAVPTSPQQFQCHRCEEPVDPVRAIAKVAGGKVVRLCSECSVLPPSELANPPAKLVAAVASATTENVAVKERRLDSELPLARGPRNRETALRVFLGVACVAAVLVATFAFRGAASSSKLAVVVPAPAPIAVEERPKTELLSLTTDPIELIEPASELLAEGDGWVHPVVGSEEQVPSKRTRLFKAVRPGERPEECGRGHCGVDLGGPRGTPVVAIRDGIIEKVIKDPDAKGGRYVWIFHEDIGLRTEYFHFDQIAPDVRAGDPVEAGQWLGTLGRTGIEHSQPHLHFTVRDATQDLRYVDPLPWLETASILPLLEMRLASSD